MENSKQYLVLGYYLDYDDHDTHWVGACDDLDRAQEVAKQLNEAQFRVLQGLKELGIDKQGAVISAELVYTILEEVGYPNYSFWVGYYSASDDEQFTINIHHYEYVVQPINKL